MYNCSKGYDLSGSHMSTCQQQGWSSLPQCQGRTRILGEGSGVVGGGSMGVCVSRGGGGGGGEASKGGVVERLRH